MLYVHAFTHPFDFHFILPENHPQRLSSLYSEENKFWVVDLQGYL